MGTPEQDLRTHLRYLDADDAYDDAFEREQAEMQRDVERFCKTGGDPEEWIDEYIDGNDSFPVSGAYDLFKLMHGEREMDSELFQSMRRDHQRMLAAHIADRAKRIAQYVRDEAEMGDYA